MFGFLKKAKKLGSRAKKEKKKNNSVPPEHVQTETEINLRHAETDDKIVLEHETEHNPNTIKISGYHHHPDTQKSSLGPEQDKLTNIYIQRKDAESDSPVHGEEEDFSPPNNQTVVRKPTRELTIDVPGRFNSPKKKSRFSRLATLGQRTESLGEVANEEAEIQVAIVDDINGRADIFARSNQQHLKTVTWGTSPSFGPDVLPFRSEEDIPITKDDLNYVKEPPMKQASRDFMKEAMKDAMTKSTTAGTTIGNGNGDTICTSITERTKASFQEPMEISTRKKLKRGCWDGFKSCMRGLMKAIGLLGMILILHTIVFFASFSYERKLVRWLLNFPLLAFFLSYTQVFVMHFVVESGLALKLRTLNLGYVDKLSYSKFAIIKPSHKILLLIITLILQIGTGFLVHQDDIAFNMFVIVVSCFINVILNLAVWYLIYMRRDNTSSSKQDQNRYMLTKQLANLNKIHEDLLKDMKQTKKMLQIREDSKMVFGANGGMNSFVANVIYASALNAASQENIRLDMKLNLQEEYLGAQKRFTTSFLVLLLSLAQFLGQSQYIRIFGEVDETLGKVVGVAIGFMIIADIPSAISGLFPYMRTSRKIDEIISVIITASVYRFIALEFTEGENLIALAIIKVVYKFLRIFYRILYYSVIRKRIVKKITKKKMIEFSGLYTPDLLEKEESSLMDSLEKFSAYQFTEIISTIVFILAIVVNRYGFNDSLNFTLDMEDDYFKVFYIVLLVELACDVLMLFAQMSVIKCSRFTEALKAKKMKIFIDNVKHNFKLLLMINLFCFYALYFYYSNRNILE